MNYSRGVGVAVGLLLSTGVGIFACVGDEAVVNNFGNDAGSDSGANAADGSNVTPTDSGGGGTDSGDACEGGATTCNGTCIDTTSSAANCGRCAHDCGAGATCSNSVCQSVLLEGNPDGGGAPIVTLTTDQTDDNPAANAGHILWSVSSTTLGGVFEDNPTGGNLIKLSTSTDSTNSIVVNGGTAYWTGYFPGGVTSPVYEATLGMAGSQTQLGMMSSADLVAITFDATDHLVVGSYGGFGVFKCTTPAPGTCSIEATYTGTPSLNVATDGTSLFVADQATGFFVIELLGAANGSSVPVNAATPTLLRVNGKGASAFLYWANSGTQTLWRSELSLTTPKQIASSATADGLAADAVNVYWTDPTTGSVNYAPIGGGGSTTTYAMLGPSSNPMRMVRDKSSLYFIHNTAIYRLALP